MNIGEEGKFLIQKIYQLIQNYPHISVRVETDVLSFPGLKIRLPERMVILNETSLLLSSKEFDTLVYLAAHPDWVFSRKQIYENVWSDVTGDADNAVMCLIYGLRKKMAAKSKYQYIQTVHGVGYRFHTG